MDITNFMNWFILQFRTLVVWVFNTLDSITFMGTSLLRFPIMILLIGVLFDIMLSLVHSRGAKEQAKKINNDRKEGSGESAKKE